MQAILTFWRDRIQWYGAEHPEVDMTASSQQLAYFLSHESDASEAGVYVMINGSDQQLDFGIHADTGRSWNRLLATSLPAQLDIVDVHTSTVLANPHYRVNPRSVVVLAR